MTKNWRKNKLIFQFFKSFRIVVIKNKRCIFLGKLYKRLSYNSIVIDKLIIEVIKAKEGLDAFYSIKGLLVADCFNLFRINFNPIYTNNKPKVFCMFYPKFIFFNISL